MANYPISHTLHVSDWLPQFVFLFEQSAKKRKSALNSYSFSQKRERKSGKDKYANARNNAGARERRGAMKERAERGAKCFCTDDNSSSSSHVNRDTDGNHTLCQSFTASPRRLFNSHFVPQNTSMLFSCSNLLQF